MCKAHLVVGGWKLVGDVAGGEPDRARPVPTIRGALLLVLVDLGRHVLTPVQGLYAASVDRRVRSLAEYGEVVPLLLLLQVPRHLRGSTATSALQDVLDCAISEGRELSMILLFQDYLREVEEVVAASKEGLEHVLLTAQRLLSGLRLRQLLDGRGARAALHLHQLALLLSWVLGHDDVHWAILLLSGPLLEPLLQLLDPVLELLSMLRHNWPLGCCLVGALCPVSEKAAQELGPLILRLVDGVAGSTKGLLPQNLVIGALS